MTTEECIAAIATHVGHWGWYLDRQGAIRAEIYDTDIVMCPLTALARFETGKRYGITLTLRAARALNVTEETAMSIANAADNSILRTEEVDRALLQACRIFV